MALSRPLLGVQSPIQCQMCTHDAKISWKCLECDLLMCSECKNSVHSQAKTTKEHRIINIKEIGLYDNKNASASNENNICVALHVLEEFQTKLGYVECLAVSSDDYLWIGDGKHKEIIPIFNSHTGLQKVKTANNKLKVISSFNIELVSISMTPNNDLLIVTKGSRLKQIKNRESKITDTGFDFEPYELLAVHVTSKYKVILGVWDERDNTCLVWVMNHAGKQERAYGKNETKNISFNKVLRITDTSNDNIFVIDTDNEKLNGSIIVLGLDNIINTYAGQPVINTEELPFTPTDLATTPADNVIIVDENICVLHVLNASGELITYINTEDKGILFPNSICLTMAGQFCILCQATTSKEGIEHKGKLYKLNITGI